MHISLQKQQFSALDVKIVGKLKIWQLNGYNDPFILETGHQKHMNMILYTCAFCEQSFDNQPAKNLHLALWHYDKTEVTNEFNIEKPTNQS